RRGRPRLVARRRLRRPRGVSDRACQESSAGAGGRQASRYDRAGQADRHAAAAAPRPGRSMNDDTERHEAIRATLAGCVLTACAQTAFTVLAGYTLGDSPIVWCNSAHVVWATALAIVLWRTRARISLRGVHAVFVLLALSYAPVLFTAELVAAARGIV